MDSSTSVILCLLLSIDLNFSLNSGFFSIVFIRSSFPSFYSFDWGILNSSSDR